MTPGLGHDLGSRVGVEVDRDLVAHGSGRHEDRSLSSHELRRSLFEAVDRGIFAVDIVSHFGARHGLPHVVCGMCYRIGSQVDNRVIHKGILPAQSA